MCAGWSNVIKPQGDNDEEDNDYEDDNRDNEPEPDNGDDVELDSL